MLNFGLFFDILGVLAVFRVARVEGREIFARLAKIAGGRLRRVFGC